jgi:hypothetical protein
VFVKEVIDTASGDKTSQLVNAGDGKFHACPPAKPAAKPAASKPKIAGKPVSPATIAKPTNPAPAAEIKPATTLAKTDPTAEQLRDRVAKESNDVLCETAIDIMASARKMPYAEMDASVTKRMMTYGMSRIDAVKAMAKDLNVDVEKQGVPLSKAAPDIHVPPAPQAPDTVPDDCETNIGQEGPPPLDETALAIATHDDNVAISEYSEEELERGVEVDFEAWATSASRTFLSVEKATKENLILKFLKGGKVVKRRSKFEQEARDKDGNVILALDAENKPIMEADGKGGFKPKVKKIRPIQDWVPVTDRSGIEYLLNVNPGMRKMLGKFKNEAGGTFDCWFRLKGEGRGKAYTCVITPVKEDGTPLKDGK